jgi:hypothetical protein
MSVKEQVKHCTSTGLFGVCEGCLEIVEMTRPDPAAHKVMRAHTFRGKRCRGSGQESHSEFRGLVKEISTRVTYV